MLDMSSDVCLLSDEEERILSSFTRRFIEIAAGVGARGTGTSATDALNTMRLPAIALDRRGFVVEVNAAADTVFDNDVKIEDKRLFVRDLEARARRGRGGICASPPTWCPGCGSAGAGSVRGSPPADGAGVLPAVGPSGRPSESKKAGSSPRLAGAVARLD